MFKHRAPKQDQPEYLHKANKGNKEVDLSNNDGGNVHLGANQTSRFKIQQST
jgi:hypothetical protein